MYYAEHLCKCTRQAEGSDAEPITVGQYNLSIFLLLVIYKPRTLILVTSDDTLPTKEGDGT